MTGHGAGHRRAIEDFYGEGLTERTPMARGDDVRQRRVAIAVVSILGAGCALRRVTEHVADGRVCLRNRGRVSADRIVECQRPALDALHQQRRGERLGQRRDVVQRVWRGGDAGVDILKTVRVQGHDLSPADDC